VKRKRDWGMRSWEVLESPSGDRVHLLVGGSAGKLIVAAEPPISRGMPP
jgi:hypothetical protein